MMKKRTFLVFLSVPAEAVTEAVEVLIEDAVKAACAQAGGFDPGSVEVVAAGSTRRAGEARKLR